MLLYFFTLFYWITLLFLKRKRPRNIDLFWAVLPLFLIMGLKAVSVGCDTISYYDRYIDAKEFLLSPTTITEPLYNAISYFFHDVLGVSYFFFNATISLFFCFVLALFIKYYSDNIYFSLIIYMTIGLFTPMMSGLRQSIAISLCTIPLIIFKAKEFAMSQLLKYRIYYYIIAVFCVIAAYMIHNSAIIFLPILFFRNIRLTRSQIHLILFASLAVFFIRDYVVNFMGGLVMEKYERYDLSEGYAMNFLVLLVPIVIAFFCSIVSNPRMSTGMFDKDISLMFVFLSLQIVFVILTLSHNQIARLGYYFMNSYIVLIPYSVYSRPKEQRVVLMVCIIILCMVFFYLGTDGGTLRIDNYKFFWQESLPYK